MAETLSYLDDVIPDYEAQCMAMGFVMIATFVFWVVVFPLFVSKLLFEESPASPEKKADESRGKDQ